MAPERARSALCLALVLLCVGGCAHRPGAGHTVSPEPLVRFAPPPEGVEEIYLTALAVGRLVYRDGCFRITGGHQPGSGTALIWPHDYVAIERDGRQGVMDTAGRTAFEGEHVRLGGGGVDVLHAGVVHRHRAARCGGPYFGAYLAF